MTLAATLDIAFQIETVRSIDVINQGLFYLKVDLTYWEDNEEKSANPFSIILSGQRSNSVFSSPNAECYSYNSQIFQVKFFDEIIQLNEICLFRINYKISCTNLQALLRVQLLCIPFLISFSQSELEKISHSSDLFEVKLTQEYKLTNLTQGFNQYLPIYMIKGFALLFNSYIHSYLAGFSFDKGTEKFKSFEKIKFRDLSNQWFCRAVLEEFFGGQHSISKKEIFRVYDKVVMRLTGYYENTRRMLLKMLDNGHEVQCSKKLLDLNLEIERFREGFNGDESQLNDAFTFVDSEQSSKILGRGLWSITKNLSNLHELFVKTLQHRSSNFSYYLQKKFSRGLSLYYNSRKHKTRLICESFSEVPYQDYSTRHSCIADICSNPFQLENLEDINVYPKIFEDPNSLPFIFIDTLCKSALEPAPSSPLPYFPLIKVKKSSSLIVLVHGLHGTSTDMRIIRNSISKHYPSTHILCSYYNESKTNGNIFKMGKRLSNEIKKYISDNFYSESLNSLSFIGYSLGGLIIRSSLPHLQDFHSAFNFFLTLSSPHLGCSIHKSKLVEAGIWIIKKLKKCKSLSQLSLTDSKSFESSFVFCLSKMPEIQNFKHVCFVASSQDSYSPIDSALCEIKNREKERNQNLIAKNILGLIRAEKVLRIDASFRFEKSGIDKMLGRAAHMQMIENMQLIEMILDECSEFFE